VISLNQEKKQGKAKGTFMGFLKRTCKVAEWSNIGQGFGFWGVGVGWAGSGLRENAARRIGN